MPATTRAKFFCAKVDLISSTTPELDENGEQTKDEQGHVKYRRWNQPTFFLNPVYAPDDDGHENHKFWTASPSGSMQLTINNPLGAEVFEPGKFYYVDFTEAPEK